MTSWTARVNVWNSFWIWGKLLQNAIQIRNGELCIGFPINKTSWGEKPHNHFWFVKWTNAQNELCCFPPCCLRPSQFSHTLVPLFTAHLGNTCCMQKQVIKSVLTLFACWQRSVAVEPMVLMTINHCKFYGCQLPSTVEVEFWRCLVVGAGVQ